MYSCMNIDSVPTTVFFFQNPLPSAIASRVKTTESVGWLAQPTLQERRLGQSRKYMYNRQNTVLLKLQWLGSPWNPTFHQPPFTECSTIQGYLLSRALLDHFVHVEKFFNGSSESDRHYSGTAMHTTWVTPRGWAFAYFTMRNVLDNTRECDRRYWDWIVF